MLVELFGILVFLAVIWYAVRLITEDVGWLIRGQTPPRVAARMARQQRRAARSGGSRRYGARSYLADVWSDAWQAARDRRVDKRQARQARRAAGQPRWPRLAEAREGIRRWWRTAGGSRVSHHRSGQMSEELRPGILDRAWDRYEQRRANRAARRAAGEPGWLGRIGQRLGWTRRGQAAATNGKPGPGGPAGTGPPGGDQHRVPVTPQRGNAASSGSPRPPGPGPAAAGEQVRRPAHPSTEHRRDRQMAEITGLGTATTFAGEAEKANAGATSEWEQAIASMQAGGVGGPAVEAAHRAMEAQQQAAAAAAEARAAFEGHGQVKEAYEANPGAGDREFVTQE